MRSLRVLLGAGGLALHLWAAAGVTGTIRTELSAVQSPVSYSNPSLEPPLNSLMAFGVTVANVGGNVANSVLFTGSISDPATFHSVEGATCDSTATTVSCSFGQLRPGDSRSFTVLFNAPAAPGPATATFDAVTYFSEGTGGPKSKPNNSSSTASAEVLLEHATGNSAASVVPGNGTKFVIYTVPDGVFDTRVTVPPQAAHTTAKITEVAFSASQPCSNFVVCYTSTLEIPGTFAPYLEIVLQHAPDNIKKGTQIGRVQLWYDYLDSDDNPQSHPVGFCADATTPRDDHLPCLVSAVHYRNLSVPGWTPALDGYMVWGLISKANGSFRLP